MKQKLHVLIVWAVVALIFVFGIFIVYSQLSLPDVAEEDADSTSFSAERAFVHLKSIAANSHKVWTPEHDNVRNYIVNSLTDLNLKPEVQEGISEVTTYRNNDIGLHDGYIQNIIVRIKGKSSDKAVLAVAHYDSAYTSNGAGDDGLGTATLLETIRAVKAGETLDRDVIFLFSDGEEEMGLGARAFGLNHPWIKDVGVVLNFEGLNQGPSTVLETTDNDNKLMDYFLHNSAHPVAYSVLSNLFKNRNIGFLTDGGILEDFGVKEITLSPTKNMLTYHTYLDNIENISLRTLQHEGDNALSLLRGTGNVVELSSEGEETVFFTIFKNMTVIYSAKCVIPIMAVITIILCITVFIGYKKNALKIKKIVICFLTSLFSVALAVGFGLLLDFIKNKTSFYSSVDNGNPSASYMFIYKNYNVLMLLVIALLTIVISLIYYQFYKRQGFENLMIGSMITWETIMIITSIYAQKSSYLFALPLLFAILSILIQYTTQKHILHYPKLFIIVAFNILPGIILFGPLGYLFFEAFVRMGAIAALMFGIGIYLTLFLPTILEVNKKIHLSSNKIINTSIEERAL